MKSSRTIMSWCFVALFWAMVTIVVRTNSTTTLPLPSLSFSAFEYSQPFLNFSFSSSSLNGNQVLLGLTLQVALEDCTQGTRWFLTPGVRIDQTAHDGSWALFDNSYDTELCALFIVPRNQSISPTVLTVLGLLRSVWFYAAVASPAALSASLRVSWTFWIDQVYVTSAADTQHMFYCLPSSGTNLNYGSAVAMCQSWLQDPADTSTAGATLVALYTAKVERMISSMRERVSAQYADPSTGQIVGYVTLIGLFGSRSQWDNGLSLSYKNFAAANPAGSFPTVFDQNSQWKSVLSVEPFSYCCESTASGTLQETANGFARLASAQEDGAVLPSVTISASKTLLDPNYPTVFPFANLSVPTANSSRLTDAVFGFTASIHHEDCDGSFRFSSVESSALFRTTFEDDTCAVRIVPLSAAGGSRPPVEFLGAIKALSIIDIRGGGYRSNASTHTAPNFTIRVVWGFLLGDATPWTVGFSPVPHYYMCTWGSASFKDASDACGRLIGGANEAYLATPQYAWEGSLLASLIIRAGNVTLDDVWIGMDTLLSTTQFSNGDPILSYTNWGVSQPLMNHQPAALSSIDVQWVSRSRTTQHSYCCEATSIPSRRAAGVITVHYSTSTTSSGNRAAAGGLTTIEKVVTPPRTRPFADVAAHVTNQSTLSRVVYGVTIQLSDEDCVSEYRFSDAFSLPRLALASTLPSAGLVFCPSTTGSCPSMSSDLQRMYWNRCAAFMRHVNGSGAPAQYWLQLLRHVELQSARLPRNVNATTALKGRFRDTISAGWALWQTQTASLSVSAASPQWLLEGTVFDPSTGDMFLCPIQITSSTSAELWSEGWTSAVSTCRGWSDDAYLATVSDAASSRNIELARNITHYYRASSSSSSLPDVWLGLLRNSSTWINGDPVVFSNWDAGQPTAVGPALMRSSGKWENVPLLSFTATSLAATAAVCCKRNSYNQFSANTMGRVTLRASTLSISSTPGTITRSEDPTSSRSVALDSATVPASLTVSKSIRSSSRSFPDTRSNILASQTETFSIKRTTSAQLTTPPATSSLTVTVSTMVSSTASMSRLRWSNETQPLSLSPLHVSASQTYPTLSETEPLPPIARVEWTFPLTFQFSADDIRSGDPRRRSIHLETVFTAFNYTRVMQRGANASLEAAVAATQRDLAKFVTLSLSAVSRYVPSTHDFTALGGSKAFLSTQSFTVPTGGGDDSSAASSLVVILEQREDYYPLSDEVLVLSVHRNATTMTPTQPPLSASVFEFEFSVTRDDTDSSMAVRVATTVLAVLSAASPDAVRDQQFIYLLGSPALQEEGSLRGGGAQLCTRTYVTRMGLEGLRVASPAHWDSSDAFSLWVGAGSLPVGVFVVHTCVWFFHALFSSEKKHSAAAVYFPSLSIFVIRGTLVAFASYSIVLLQSSQEPENGSFRQTSREFIAGVCGLAFLGTATLAVWGWSVVCGLCFAPKYVAFSDEEMSHHYQHNSAALLVASQGEWVGRTASIVHRCFWWVCGEYRFLWYVALEWAMSWLMAWTSTYAPIGDEGCYHVYGAVGAVFFALMFVVGIARPFSAPLQNLLAIMSLVCLGSIMFCSIAQISSPNGTSRTALVVFRWALVVIGMLRGIATVLSVQFAIHEDRVDNLDGPHPGGKRLSVARSPRRASSFDFDEIMNRRPSSMNREEDSDKKRRASTKPPRLSSFKFPVSDDEDDDPFEFAEKRHSRVDVVNASPSKEKSFRGVAPSPGRQRSVRWDKDYDTTEAEPQQQHKRGSLGALNAPRQDLFSEDDDDFLFGSDAPFSKPRGSPSPQVQAGSGGLADRRFSMGSMRRFGSQKIARRSTVAIPTFESDGDSSDDDENGGKHTQRSEDKGTRVAPQGATAMHHQDELTVRGLSSGSPASPVAVRLSSLFTPSVQPRRDSPEDPFAAAPQFPHRRRGPPDSHVISGGQVGVQSTRFGRLESVLGDLS